MTTSRQQHATSLHPLVVGFTNFLQQHALGGDTGPKRYAWFIASATTAAGKSSPEDLTTEDLTKHIAALSPSLIAPFKTVWKLWAKYMAEEVHRPTAAVPWKVSTRQDVLDPDGYAYNYLFFLPTATERAHKRWLVRLQIFLAGRPAEQATPEELKRFMQRLPPREVAPFCSVWNQFRSFTAKYDVKLPELATPPPVNSYMAVCPQLVQHLAPFLQATQIWGAQIQFLTFDDVTPTAGGWNFRVGFKEKPDKDEPRLHGCMQRRTCFLSKSDYDEHLLPMLIESYPPNGAPPRSSCAIFPTVQGGSEFGLDRHFVEHLRLAYHRLEKHQSVTASQPTGLAAAGSPLPAAKPSKRPSQKQVEGLIKEFVKAFGLKRYDELPYFAAVDFQTNVPRPDGSLGYCIWTGPRNGVRTAHTFSQKMYDQAYKPLLDAYWPDGLPADPKQPLFPEKMPTPEKPVVEKPAAITTTLTLSSALLLPSDYDAMDLSGKTIEEIQKMLETETNPDNRDSMNAAIETLRYDAAKAKETK